LGTKYLVLLVVVFLCIMLGILIAVAMQKKKSFIKFYTISLALLSLTAIVSLIVVSSGAATNHLNVSDKHVGIVSLNGYRENLSGSLRSIYCEIIEISVRNGQGTFTFEDGSVYTGDFNNGKADGRGTYKSINGWEYIGQFKEGLKSGEGTIIYSDGSVYKGEWKDDKEQGYGEFTSSFGWRYKGQWSAGKRQGEGFYYYEDGSVYHGNWENNMENGLGTYTSVQGWMYSGNWLNGLFNGYGKLTYSDGSYYEGNWINNVKQGQGIQTYMDELGHYYGIYSGAFFANKRTGLGTLRYATGEVLHGIWQDDSFLG